MRFAWKDPWEWLVLVGMIVIIAIPVGIIIGIAWALIHFIQKFW